MNLETLILSYRISHGWQSTKALSADTILRRGAAMISAGADPIHVHGAVSIVLSEYCHIPAKFATSEIC